MDRKHEPHRMFLHSILLKAEVTLRPLQKGLFYDFCHKMNIPQQKKYLQELFLILIPILGIRILAWSSSFWVWHKWCHTCVCVTMALSHCWTCLGSPNHSLGNPFKFLSPIYMLEQSSTSHILPLKIQFSKQVLSIFIWGIESHTLST